MYRRCYLSFCYIRCTSYYIFKKSYFVSIVYLLYRDRLDKPKLNLIKISSIVNFLAKPEIQEASILIGPVRALVKLRSSSVLARFMAPPALELHAENANIFVVYTEIIKKYRILWEFPMSWYWISKVMKLFGY